MAIYISEEKYTMEELRAKFPHAVNYYTREEARELLIKAMDRFPGELGPDQTLENLLKKFEETYGFKEGSLNEFGEVSP